MGILLGVMLIVLVENNLDKNKQFFYKSSLLLGISIAVHNFPEGLALGSSFLTMTDLGPTLSLAMLLHNIPEVFISSYTLRINRNSPWKILFYTILTGIPTGIGAFFGAYMGMLSSRFIALCLSFAGGTMLYIICDEIIPGAKVLHKGRASSLGVLLGFIFGIILYFK